MKVLVTGKHGRLGAAIAAELSPTHDVVTLSRTDLDICQVEAVRQRVFEAGPQAIINCVAYNDVDGAEENPVAALNANALGVRALAQAAADSGASLVHYSTDFVFDGETDRPYVESDQPNPKSTYASSKLLGEWFAGSAPRHYVLRVESLFGPGGRGQGSVDRIIDAIDEGRDAPVFVDRVVSPAYVVDISVATRALLETGAPYGLYHCASTGYATWYELAEHVAGVMGRIPRLRRVSVKDVKLRAARPRFAALSSAKLASVGITMPTWQDALARYIASRVVQRAGPV